MASADVKIIWDDQSQIPQSLLETQDTVDYPIIMTVFSADKGPEEWKQRLSIDDMKAYYGNTPSFYKHGQVLIQAYDGADAGARMTCKRIVDDDSMLANIGVVANLNLTSYQRTDENGNTLWYDTATTGNPITTTPQYDAAGNPDASAMVLANQINIDFSLVSVVMQGNDVSNFANAFYAANKHTGTLGSASDKYALFLFLDNGRGVSNKRFRIYRDTSRSSPVKYVRYFIEVSENGEVLETLPFTMNPDIVEADRNTSLSDVILRRSKQIRAVIFEDEFKAFTENVSALAGLSNNEYAYADCLFGTNLYGKSYSDPIPGSYAKIVVSTNPVNLSTVYGIQLLNGSNGTSFGDRPILASNYAIKMIEAYNGYFDDCIYDVDNNRVDAIFDANLPEAVKREIEGLVNFREDCMFFRDLGLNIRGIEDIHLAFNTNAISKSRFCATYINSYDIYDPWTKKQINVTIMYNLVRLFVKHFINGRNRPFCGQRYECVIPTTDMIPGSLNFMPKRTPAVDQKQELDDLRVNYAAMYEGSIIAIASEYTSQEQYTQLSYINNVLAVQEVIKAIRVVCPKIRYAFIDEGSEDLLKYKQDVQDLIISKYANRFKYCAIEYVTNEIYTLNKIIYAVIKVRFRDFVQTEYFKITALI